MPPLRPDPPKNLIPRTKDVSGPRVAIVSYRLRASTLPLPVAESAPTLRRTPKLLVVEVGEASTLKGMEPEETSCLGTTNAAPREGPRHPSGLAMDKHLTTRSSRPLDLIPTIPLTTYPASIRRVKGLHDDAKVRVHEHPVPETATTTSPSPHITKLHGDGHPPWERA